MFDPSKNYDYSIISLNSTILHLPCYGIMLVASVV
jgi:hypothetical protein